MGGWGGERVIGKTQSPASPGSLAGRRASTPALPASLPARPAGFPSPGCSGCRRWQPLRAGGCPARGSRTHSRGAGGGKSLEKRSRAGARAGAGAGGERPGERLGRAARALHLPPARRRCCSDFSSPSKQSLPRTAPLVSPSPPGLLPAAAALR